MAISAMTGLLKRMVLRALKASGVLALSRRLTRNRLRVLTYHGFELADEAAFRPSMYMRRETFERRMRLIKRMGFKVVALDAAVEQLRSDRLEPDQLVITTDDGWASFARVAQPELQRHGFHSTLYVTSYYVQHPAPVFRMVVQYMFWKSTRETIEFDGVPWTTDRTVAMRQASAADQAMWQAIAYGELQCDQPGRELLCADLGRRLGVPYESIAGSRCFNLMTPEELRQAQGAGVAIELHSHRHRFPLEDEEACRQEIEDNRRQLEAWIGRRPNHFCYPSGEWARHQVPWLERMGVLSATTCEPGLNDAQTSPHAIRRILDSEQMHELELESALSGFNDLVSRLRSTWQPGRA